MRQPQDTILSAFLTWEQQTPQSIFLRQMYGDNVRTWTFQQAGEEVRRLVTALNNLNLAPCSNIGIVAESSSYWILADLAIMFAGHVSVPIDPSLPADKIAAIADHAELQVVFLGSTAQQLEGAMQEKVVKVSLPSVSAPVGVTWESFVANTEATDVRLNSSSVRLASIVYNKGGNGAMLSHQALYFSGTQVKSGLRLQAGQHVLSALPLASAAGRLYGELAPINAGCTVSFYNEQHSVENAILKLRPSVLVADTAVFTSLRARVLKSLPERRLSRMLRLPGFQVVLQANIRRKLGLDRASSVICAGQAEAGLPQWFAKIGVEVRESFAPEESCGLSHANFRLVRHGTAGQPWPWVEVRFAQDGEMELRSPALMDGYYKNPEASREVLTSDGFFKTGYRGQADAQGFLTVLGNVLRKATPVSRT